MGPMGRASSGSKPATDIAAWVAATYPASVIDGVTVYELTASAST
jgi:hypothetical protein